MALMDALKKMVFVTPDDDDDDEAAAPAEPKAERKEKKTSRTSYADDFSAPGVKKARVVNINSASQKIVVVKLDSYTGAKVIIDHLKEKTPVVFNIARLDRADAGRAVDVVYGASYALDGSMQKVSNDIFLVTPYGVEITGDITEKLAGVGDFSLDV